jgi:NitT/TauT family transport system ATP-binding protein
MNSSNSSRLDAPSRAATAGDQDSQKPAVVVHNVSKIFTGGRSETQALMPLSFEIKPKEFVAVVGASGSGKSTLLRIIGGLQRPTTGTVLFQGQPVTEPHPEIGIVFQKTNLMPWRTALENVLLPVEIRQGAIQPADEQRALDLLALLGLSGFEDAYPQQLSGGMAQRVVLARTLIQQPRLLLLDEPFGALDALTRERLNLELLRVRQLHHQTVLMVTHSIDEAVLLADRVLVLSDQPGRLVGQIVVDLPRPRQLSMMGSERFAQLAWQVRKCLGKIDGRDGC